jgi:hypothetical protein
MRKDDKGEFFWDSRLQKARYEPTIPLGSEGVLNGISYRMICYAERKDDHNAIWREYILFNEAEHKHVFLSEYDGHWTLLEPLEKTDVNVQEMATHKGTLFREEEYKLYSKYTASYVHARGEFYWPMYREKMVPVREYIAPPHMLTKEGTAKDADYFFGTYQSRSAISKAFSLPVMPYRTGTGMIQPFYGGIDVGIFAKGALVFTILIIIINIFLSMLAREQQVFSHTFPVDTGTVNKPLVSPSFTLQGNQSNLIIDAYARVSNSWVEADVSLVNESTHEERAFVTGVEFYSGYDGGESWSEGSWSKEETICAVEPGTYHFVITPSKDPAAFLPVDMTLQATWDVPVWWNAMLVVIIMGVITGALYLLEMNFERNRWYNSDYSPYTYDE